MAKLILGLDGSVLNEIPLTKERTSIGRKPHNDIQIDNLAVSGEHAVVVAIGNDCFLEDVGSTNGTMVNGMPVKRHMLRNNDVIELGKYKLTFVGQSEAPAPSAADYEKTMVWRPAAAKQASAPVDAAAAKQPAAPGSAGAAGTRAATGDRAAQTGPGVEPSDARKPIWKIGLVVLVILVVVFLTYGMRG